MQRSLNSASCLWPCHLPNIPLCWTVKEWGVANLWWLTTCRRHCHDFHIPITGCLSNWSSLCFRLPWNRDLPHWMEINTSFLFLAPSCFPFLLLLNTEHPYSGSKESSGQVASRWSLLLCVSSPYLYPLADCECCLPRTWPRLACFWVPCHQQRSQ